ncbi:MAG TPA: thioredoxin domain-containing protein [Candidatus Thermoplasmatota archaeon]|nr:thioredoxin domain-containing protein [Candidatus Thermoplasmatota archaeon]
MPNRLASERSAYLRSAAHQPVDWHPWGAEAFARAKAEDKPILLDVGAVWCHWCHVLDRESYDDPDLAKLLNELFVCVKVDRDERPDVDARYQAAVQALSGQGGWPLTAFLTPEGKVFFGGTYFPPDDRYGRPGFRTVLQRVAAQYHERREDLLAHAEHLAQELQRMAARHEPGDLDARVVQRALEILVQHHDPINGGFGTAPKFPHPSAMELCLAAAMPDDAMLRAVATTTLDAMARGGVYDQLGGGFHRYSVDAEWIVPHFEKMLYDNAGLLRNYAHATMLWRQPLHRATAEGIVAWLRSIELDGGGFAGSQDADVGLEDDGDYWTWTLDELRAALPDADLQALLADHFDIGPRGEMHHDPRKNVLWVAKDAERLARERGLPFAMVEEQLGRGKAVMFAARATRAAPVVDRTLYASWNGMAAGALLEAWKALGDTWCRDGALRALDRILEHGWRQGEGVAHVVRGSGEVWGLLEDQAWVASALLDAYEVRGAPRYLEAARGLLGLVVERYQEPSGALRDTARGREGETAGLGQARAPIEDAPSASPTSVAILALDKLAALTSEARWREAAERALRAHAGSAPKLGLFASAYILALDRHLQPATHVVIVGDAADLAAQRLHETALRTFHPGMVVSPPAREGPMPEAARAALQSGLGRGSAVALVCKGTSCGPPARSPEDLARLLAARPGREGPAVRWGAA